jgi:hypothetical protein
MDAMTETLDFVKNLWGGMSIPGMNMPGIKMPGMVMPTLSVEEINKQISDLKAVESWLTLNMNMLRGTIQALEVQSATITTLKSMSEALSTAVTPKPGNKPAEAPAAKAQPSPQPKPEEKPADAADAATAQAKANAAKAAGDSSAQLSNPTAWWNMLQDQFKQAVNTALTAEMPAPASKAKAAGKSDPKATAKPAAKKAAAPRKRKAPAKTAEK